MPTTNKGFIVLCTLLVCGSLTAAACGDDEPSTSSGGTSGGTFGGDSGGTSGGTSGATSGGTSGATSGGTSGGTSGTTDGGLGDGGGGKKKNGEQCQDGAECQSGECSVGDQGFCSVKCTQENAADVCKDPAFDGKCNGRGFCRKAD